MGETHSFDPRRSGLIEGAHPLQPRLDRKEIFKEQLGAANSELEGADKWATDKPQPQESAASTYNQPRSIKMLVDFPINYADLCLLQFPGGLVEVCDSLSIREFGP